jgi:hypothetical protein
LQDDIFNIEIPDAKNYFEELNNLHKWLNANKNLLPENSQNWTSSLTLAKKLVFDYTKKD